MDYVRIQLCIVIAAIIGVGAFTLWLSFSDVPPGTSIPDWLFPPAQESRP